MDQTKQSILSGQGNTQIIGAPFEEFIAEIRRKDAEIARLTTDLAAALKNSYDAQEKDDLQSRLDALRQKRAALQKRLLDPERAFREHMQRDTQLAQILADTAKRHAIGENRINSVMQAFENFSYGEVMALFQVSEKLGLVQAASSAYAQGLIEEDSVNWQDALEHYKRAYDLDATLEHKQAYATALNNLATIYENTWRYDEAEPLFDRALSICRPLLCDDHPDMAMSLNNLAGLYRDQGRYAEAAPLLKEVVEIMERV